ncbi:putative diguanylate cyclase [Candidatus Kuenenia stuttgartiensis]|jgi:diguanylate cyclase (GGDEF)-like protein/PAS domain S-box-containing protein|uniref:Putative diguanylate cyclase n=1 Tax=Kuenenia stuttgartiensis TaxID=174633 RepID=Q1PY13_KUEST|nr:MULTISPECIES: EAL domain-containing protein [Kuenenia]MBZ0192064.1 EAL domain-containing protein [Candidatus Kuenenia stuttgartiensis]MCF6151163.1 EAL domain-containing protein [Candidatus Kuenenia stuttgartiensis]MCL4725766.1 EAL domain-containing protein [Candidatus Kuenenia stuttgartiensis]MCZ7623375.1 EAL domain-containing protein [Candidatus Kuenenia sp.]QII09691.1 putative diguanylate cyclase [Candidatus Kuenenia stuttgartiensis]
MKNEIKVLLVEDNPGDVYLVREMLDDIQSVSFSLECAYRLSSALQKLENDFIDVILLDLSLPDSQGLKTFCSIQAHASRTPIVVLSGLGDEEVAVEALKKGAQDYLIKGKIDGDSLARTMRYSMERKQIELELQDGKQRYKRLVEILPDIIYRIDANGYFTFINEAVQVFGYEPDELIGKHFSELIHPDDLKKVSRSEVLSEYSGKTSDYKTTPKLFDERRTGQRKTTGLQIRVKSKKSPEYMEYTIQIIKWPKKHEKIIEVAATGHYDSDIMKNDKRFVGTVGVIRDITGSKHAEEMICTLSLAVEQSPAMIAVTDTDGRIDYINPKFCKVTGFEPEEVLGKNLIDIIQPGGESLSMADKTLWKAITSKGEWKEAFSSRKKHGELFWTSLSLSAIKSNEGFISHYLAIMEDITEHKQAEERIHYLAYYDSLTALPNRELFHDRLNMAIIHAHRKQQMLAVAFIDIDRFKKVNDTLGHSTGDRLLKIIADRLKSCIREEDTVSRQGGDEFVLLLTEISRMEDANDVTQRILKKLKEPVIIDDHDLCISASIGIALYPGDGTTAEALLKNADSAMYISKESGRDNYHFYSSTVQEKAYEQLLEEMYLRRALENRELVLYYQPQVNIATGRLVGMEALLRWKHPKKGLISPAEFIPLAEDTGQIVPIDFWVLHTACKQNMAWQRAGLPSVPIAVNISGHTFGRENLIDFVNNVLHDTRMSPDALDLEITEGIAIQNLQTTIYKLNKLKSLGIQITIDDFGTGFSSLSYLSKFPIQKLKIGMTFIHNLHKDPTNSAIVKAVIAMAKSLQLTVIAEGVETDEQFEFLQGLQCDEFQGYLCSKAVTSEEMGRFLAKNAGKLL